MAIDRPSAMTEDFLPACQRNCRDKQENRVGEPFLIVLLCHAHMHTNVHSPFFPRESFVSKNERRDENTSRTAASRQGIPRDNRFSFSWNSRRTRADCLTSMLTRPSHLIINNHHLSLLTLIILLSYYYLIILLPLSNKEKFLYEYLLHRIEEEGTD